MGQLCKNLEINWLYAGTCSKNTFCLLTEDLESHTLKSKRVSGKNDFGYWSNLYSIVQCINRIRPSMESVLDFKMKTLH